MKKLLWLLLLFTGMVNAQPPAITSQNQTVFDTNNDNYEWFDYNTLAPQILGNNSAADYSVNFYLDANFQNLIPEGAGSITFDSNNQTIYVKVTENADPSNFATTSFLVVLFPTPILGFPQHIFQLDNPYDGIGIFDLTSQAATILNGLTGVDLVYYPTSDDAQAATNAITNPEAYTNISNPQIICVRATDQATGSYSLTQFMIVLNSVETITIPDNYFRARVNGYDYNLDGQIQMSEALSVTTLDLSNPDIWNQPIYDLTGIENFKNVKDLFIGGNPLGAVDLSALTKLENLSMSRTNCTELNVTGLTYLRSIIADTGQIVSLDVSTCSSLVDLFVPRQMLTSLNFSGLTGIITLYCNNNNLTSLDVSLLTNMTYLCCSDNNLTSLDLTGLNQITGLCYGNQAMSPVDTSHLTNLLWLSYGGGLATTLDLNTAPNLQTMLAWNSNLTELDLSGLPLVNVVRLFNNNDLTYVNMKNGGQFLFSEELSSYNSEFQSNPNLFYVCTNEVDQVAVNNRLSAATANNGVAHAGTYCTFVPGGDFNTITGIVKLDANNNGCDPLDVIHPNIKVNINDGTNIGSTFINNSGVYAFYTETGSFTIAPETENPSWFTFSPPLATVDFVDNNNNTTTQDFCLTSNGIHHDVEIAISPVTPARPGFDAEYKLFYRNKGNQTEEVFLNFYYDEDRLDFVSASTIPSNSGAGFIQWNITNVLPFESGSILITLNVNSPLEAPPVNNGDSLTFTSFIDITSTEEENWADNSFTLNQIVVGSYDPNDIVCIEGQTVNPSEIGNYLHYLARFENTGTFYAENVVVKIDVDSNKYDISTLQLLDTSHSCYTRIVGNTVEFIFEGINLEARSGNPPVGGHGDILFKIRTRSDLETNDLVSKVANIYFDYNLPVTTNTA
ncbi:MAG: T9SS C-terminal target domain-containing protein [Flavobacterium sp.]|nr:T9SS C-terminal target domain-containing protein [Flavobacterium sp.]